MNWHTHTLPIATRAVEVRSEIAAANRDRAAAHLRLSNAYVEAAKLMKMAAEVQAQAYASGDASFQEGADETFKIASMACNEAAALVAMMHQAA